MTNEKPAPSWGAHAGLIAAMIGVITTIMALICTVPTEAQKADAVLDACYSYSIQEVICTPAGRDNALAEVTRNWVTESVETGAFVGVLAIGMIAFVLARRTRKQAPSRHIPSWHPEA